ncbi:MAG: ribosomal protein S18-alanine N-acetyltransferase [Clostridia bacterium]|nr:ribosomal protein S18-alanine N-acetyltransferase [Clostridia bacterium]
MKMFSMRKAEPQDEIELKKLEEKCFDINIRENFDFVLKNDNYIYLVVLNNQQEIIAYAGISISYEQGDILSVCVNPSYRKLGLAKGLMVEILKNATERGVKTMFLEVEEDNTPAINLYLKFGFDKISERKNYYGKKTAIVMSKNL